VTDLNVPFDLKSRIEKIAPMVPSEMIDQIVPCEKMTAILAFSSDAS
jgi:hypothetical protein